MTRLVDDPAGVRGLAKMIIKIVGDELSENSHAFLSDLTGYDGAKPLSTRQKELLYALRERSTRSQMVGPHRASHLIKEAFESRFDLCEFDAEEWLEQKHAHGENVFVSNTEALRLIALCKQLGVLPHDQWIKL